MPAFDAADADARPSSLHVNPLVNWMWFGFGIIAIGTGIALLPETAFAFAAAKVPAGAVTTALLLLCAAALSPALAVRAGRDGEATQRSELRRSLEKQIMCTCGCRRVAGRLPDDRTAPTRRQTARLIALLDEGKDHDEVLRRSSRTSAARHS